jgi:hypothetical protein
MVEWMNFFIQILDGIFHMDEKCKKMLGRSYWNQTCALGLKKKKKTENKKGGLDWNPQSPLIPS